MLLQAEHSRRSSEIPKQLHESEQGVEYTFQLADIIEAYEAAVRLGPAGAKTGLGNIVEQSHRFGTNKIRIRQADTVSENRRYSIINTEYSSFFYQGYPACYV